MNKNSETLALQFLNQQIQNNSKILVAVSGGIDSICLTHWLLAHNFNIAIVHCNFQLREQDSDNDEIFVKEFANQLNIDFYSKKFETKKFCEENKFSIQVGARKLRYEFFNQILDNQGINYLALAHHANDQTENFILTWVKNRNFQMIESIPLVNQKIIRPFLFFTKNEIEQYAAENQLVWRDDQSNFSDKYYRNKIRHQIIPPLLEINPSLISFLSEKQKDYLEQIEILNEIFETLESEIWKDNYLILNELDRKSEAFQKQFYIWWGKKNHLTRFEIDSIMDLRESENGKKIITENFIVYKQENAFYFSPKIQENKVQSIEIQLDIIQFPYKFLWNKKEFILNKIIFEEPIQDSNFIQIKVDFNKPIQIRIWELGDKMQGIGMKGYQKISDILKNLKFKMPEKYNKFVVEQENEILFLEGYRISEKCKAKKGDWVLLGICSSGAKCC